MLPKINFKEWGKSLLFALIIAGTFRAFLYEPYKIPSGSMYPTLKIGDFLFLNKYQYGYSNHSVYGLPLFKKRFLFKKPHRGDIVVFQSPDKNSSYKYIKRLIGLPGDKIQLRRGILYINGQAVPKKYIGIKQHKDQYDNQYIYEVFEETLPNKVKYYIWDANKNSHLYFPDNTRVYDVPEGHYFFLGDNRNNSGDSRFPEMGFIAEDLLLGRLAFLFWNSVHPIDELLYEDRLYKLFKYADNNTWFSKR